MDTLLTPAQVADLAGCSRGTVVKRMTSGHLAYVEVDGMKRVPAEAASAFATSTDVLHRAPNERATMRAARAAVSGPTIRHRVLAAGAGYGRGNAPILFTCKTREMAMTMAGACGFPTRICTVRV